MLERPMGLRQSSPLVCKKYVATNHMGLTPSPGVTYTAAHAMTRKPIPRRMRPMPNFRGKDGFHLPRASQSHPKMGAKMMMKMGFIAWSQLAGASHPKITRSVCSAAKMFRADPACSNPDQNKAAPTKRKKITTRRFFSTVLKSPNIRA